MGPNGIAMPVRAIKIRFDIISSWLLSGQNHKFVPGLEAQIWVSARRDERAMPERIVSEKQRRDGPEMGFPEGPGAFGLRLRRASLTDRCGYARSALLDSLRTRSGKPGTNL